MRDSSILVIAVFVLIISAFVSYSGDDITGYSTVSVSDSVVSVYPTNVEIGATITISIYPGEDGINKYASFLKGVSPRSSITLCNNSRCLTPDIAEFTIPESWSEGAHSLKFYDYGTASYREVHFNIRRK